MRFDRNKRISEEIKKIVSQLLMYEIRDPRIPKFISVTHVDTTRDHRFTYIYLSVFDEKINLDEVMKGLQKAKGFIRKEIGQNIKLHYTPEPIFKFDDSIKNGMHLNDVIKGLNIKHDEEDDNEDE